MAMRAMMRTALSMMWNRVVRASRALAPRLVTFSPVCHRPGVASADVEGVAKGREEERGDPDDYEEVEEAVLVGEQHQSDPREEGEDGGGREVCLAEGLLEVQPVSGRSGTPSDHGSPAENGDDPAADPECSPENVEHQQNLTHDVSTSISFTRAGRSLDHQLL